MKARALHALLLFLRAVRTIFVAIVCLLIGFSARHLFDAYGRELIPFLRQTDLETEVRVTVTPPPSLSSQSLFD